MCRTELNKNPNSFFLSPVSENELLVLSCNLTNTFNDGYEDVPVCILKKFGIFTSHPLSFLFNLSFVTGIFPECL